MILFNENIFVFVIDIVAMTLSRA